MSNYKIALEKLSKLINPFNDETSMFFNTQGLIERLITENKIFPDKSLSLEDQKIKQLAYEISNYKEKEIVINLPIDGQINTVEDLITKELTNLYAAIYLQKEHIVAQITGNKKLAQDLLGINIDEPDNININPVESKRKVHFTVDPNMLVHTWADPDFIYNFIFAKNKTSDNFKDNLVEAFKMALPKVWDDNEFLKKIMDKDGSFIEVVTNNIDRQFKYRDNIFEITKERPKYFNKVWGNHHSGKEELQNLIENFSTLSSEVTEIKLQKYKTVERLKNEIFNDSDFVAGILTTRDMWHNELYDLVPEEVQYSKIVLDTIYAPKGKDDYSSPLDIAPHKSLPKKYTQDYEWIKDFTIKYGEHFNFSSIYSHYGQFKSDSFYVPLFSSWINDKDKILEMANSVKISDFYHVFKMIPIKLKHDDTLIDKFMKMSPNVFLELPEVKREDHLEKFLKEASYGILYEAIRQKKLNISEMIALDNRDIFVHLLQEGFYEFLKNPELPEKYKTDFNLLNQAKSAVDVIRSNEDTLVFDTLIDHEPYALQYVMKESSSFGSPIYKLPKKYHNNENILMAALQANATIPQKYYGNSEFCMKILLEFPKVAENIPSGHWYNDQFILNFCKSLDSGAIPKSVLPKIPAEITQLFSAFNITTKYAEFMENYLLNQRLHDDLEITPDRIKKKKI